MKKTLLIFFSILFVSVANAEDISKKVSEYISNLIPGEGDTEVSIDIRDNHKPDYSILAVREIEKTETGNYFTQFSLFNTEKNNDERVVGNIGIGKRNLSDDKTFLTGFVILLTMLPRLYACLIGPPSAN